MIRIPVLVYFILILAFTSSCQNSGEYQVYAIKFTDCGSGPASQMVAGADAKDSIHVCNMLWLLKGENGRNILVDAGYIDTNETAEMEKFVRPDLMLKKINVSPDDITDIIITHPHYDHIGGITLFPKAKIWMQKDDFDYFVGDAWQEKGEKRGFAKGDVRNIIEANLQGRVKTVKGDSIEIIPGIRVFTGSKHTFENQYLLVNCNSKDNKILLASDAIWFYLNYDKLLPATLCMDSGAYVKAMRRMKTLDPKYIIPGHDDLVFSKFPKVTEGIVKIGK